ncbi:MAG TPA: hypothetical protein VIY72_05855, partial [Acidimicrobiales bacterium]
IVASLPREKQGVASAVNDTSRELGAAFGVAMLGSAFNIGYRDDIADNLGGLANEAAAQAKEAPALALQIARAAGDTALGDAARGAFTSGMRYATLLGAALLVVGAVFVWGRGDNGHDEELEDELDRPGVEVSREAPWPVGSGRRG